MNPYDAFIQYLAGEKRYASRTVTLYRDILSRAEAALGEEGGAGLLGANPKDLRAYTAGLLEGGLSAATVNQHLSALSSFYRWAARQGLRQDNPLQQAPRPKTPKRLPGFYTPKALAALLDRPLPQLDAPGAVEALTDRTLVALLYHTGMRRAELGALRLNDLDFSRGQIRVTGKGNKVRYLPMNETLAQDLRFYLQSCPPSPEGALFLNQHGKPLGLTALSARVHRYLAGQQGFTGQKSPHVLRHSLATHLLNNGADLNAIKELLGHSSLAATQVYTHNAWGTLKETYLKAHPRA